MRFVGLHFLTRSCRNIQISSPPFQNFIYPNYRKMSQEYKLKDLTCLNLKPGEKKEAEVEGIEGAKVLLCNSNGTVSAIGSKCTHYGAPLVKGVLTPDGRITCPWHGACFKATNGDIENAPALDALPCFKLSEKNGSVFITGEKDSIISSRRKPNIKISNIISDEKVVVIGGGSAALATVEALREKGFNGLITMISSENYLPIDRTKLSKALIDDPSKIALRDESWFQNGSIKIIYDEVTEVDFSSKKAKTKSGNFYNYTKLILATGGTPRGLSLPGFKELNNIFTVRTTHHVKAINEAIGSKNKKIVIIGSSFIGMEMANALAKENDVTVVGSEEAPLTRVMGKEVGQFIQKAFVKNGVKFHMSASVESALPSKSDPSKVGSVELKSGTSLPVDLVILGTGVVPATSFLTQNPAINLEIDGSIKTNEHFVVDGLRDVYAIGDIATFPCLGLAGNDKPVRIEHWNVAQNSGRIAAAHIISPSAKATSFVPIFWSALGSQLRYCGNSSSGWDDLILKGEPKELKFVAYYTKGEKIVAVGSIGFDPIVVQASELMRLGAMPSKSELLRDIDILKIRMPASVKI
ncbi:Apoptosis-inducing factor 1 [Golovinomyces cichoracearum]|uniref:Apoptosis-inducing factor 1 n=1 Tax=Golovinomyces cichoracearum TaxID=62708 RepID=A0A420H8T4_9PEZI|nr:Apoptosis-inducing factor 1 [Golovinomyces cichoracearum]